MSRAYGFGVAPGGWLVALAWIFLLSGASGATPAGDFYVYAPAAVIDGAAEHVFTCENMVSGEIRDHIVHRRGAQALDRNKDVALGPAEDPRRFDSVHVCDPEIVAGRFAFLGRAYRYALLYTGNDRRSAYGNRIGIAFADSLDGPWIRSAEPLIDFDFGGDEARSWGVGQPAAVNMDRGDGFLLFYTEGGRAGTRTLMRSVHLPSRAPSEPGLSVGAAVAVSENGLREFDGDAPDFLNNAAIAYSPTSNSFVAIRPLRPRSSTQPQNIAERQEVDIVDAEALLAGRGVWRKLAVIDVTVTGSPRNHNAGLVKDPWGNLPNAARIDALVTTSAGCAPAAPCFPASLWSYRLRRVPIDAARTAGP
jgi:hypothetical protein